MSVNDFSITTKEQVMHFAFPSRRGEWAASAPKLIALPQPTEDELAEAERFRLMLREGMR